MFFSGRTVCCLLITPLILLCPTPNSALSATPARPNILLISIDDLNDWVGCLGGHPQASTPNIDALAARGTLFANAHCQAPVCQPSRASLMTSLLPSSTGIYFLNPGIADSPVASKRITLPARFAREGYQMLGTGKLFHATSGQVFSRLGEYGGGFGYFGPQPAKKITYQQGHPLWDWGAFPDETKQMPDMQIADWATRALSRPYDSPFFLAVGFFRPHVPMLVPQEWMDEHPRDQIKLPIVSSEDVNDISDYAKHLTTRHHVAPTHRWITDNNEWQHAVQAYLASATFVDACVGKVLRALEKSRYRKNTIVVLFSDHGFHLGEKQRWAKRSLWEDGTRVPLIISVPGLPTGQVCTQAAGLIDIYPTLLDLCNMSAENKHEGVTLAPQLENSQAPRTKPAITTFGPGNHAVRSERWRYIRYRDGSEELYDHRSDPHEWNNLAADPARKDVMQAHRQHLPKMEHPILGKGSTGHQAFESAETLLKKEKTSESRQPRSDY